MDIMKTGRFIAGLRKEMGWTQEELAGKLGVTDKAVSRWETGRGFPDISLLKPFSEILGITVNELLVGERIEPEYSQKKADETIIQTLSNSKRKVNKIIKGTLFSLGGIVLLYSLLFLGYDIYLIIGTLIGAVAVFRSLKRRILIPIYSIIVILFVIGISEAMDYTYIQYNMPPRFNLSIATTLYNREKVTKYNKVFYDVYWYDYNTPDEHYVIK